jgi:hypothetical protein
MVMLSPTKPTGCLFVLFVLTSCVSNDGGSQIEATPATTLTATTTTTTTTTASEAQYFGVKRFERPPRQLPASAGHDLYDCDDFSSGAEAQEVFLRDGGPAYDPYDLDRDGDGFACEYDPRQAVQPAKSTYQPQTGSSCHYVEGYRRKNGSYVRGHMRCR